MPNNTIENLKYQLALKLFTGNCDICPADTVTCHRNAKDSECKNRVDMALGEMVKGEIIEE